MAIRPLVTRYEDDLAIFPDFWHKLGVGLALVALLVFPLLASSYWMAIANATFVTIVASIGMMILTGYTGQVSLGHAAFLAIGAYTAAILGYHLGLPFWLIIPTAGIIAALVGLAIGPFALRLEGLYLAIVTVGLLFLVQYLLRAMPSLTFAHKGIKVPMHIWFAAPKASAVTAFAKSWHFPGLRFVIDGQAWRLGSFTITFAQKLYALYLLLALAAMWCGKNIQRSHTGRAMMAVRDHDLAAAVMGVNLANAKIIAFGLSSFFAGVAGAMYGFQQQHITIDPPFNLEMSVQYIAIIVIGGIGTLFGAVAGAIVYTVLYPVTESIGKLIPYLNTLSSHQQSIVLFSLVVCGFRLRVKRYFMAWPFRY